jgi:uncharacterized surface protein with fasciclin (FAS1) repeats
VGIVHRENPRQDLGHNRDRLRLDEQPMRVIRQIVLLLGIAAAGFALAAGKPAVKRPGNEHFERQTVAAVVASHPDFKTLGVTLVAAGLSEELNGDGPQTLFAPTEAAFAKLPAGTLDGLMKPENHDKLAAILRYHLVPQKVDAKQLAKLKFVPTVNGDPLTVTLDGKQVMVDNARVVKADIKASNGVIHAIDTLLMPDGK